MDFDQTYNGGPVDWNFPSPTATPTHNSFGSTLVQTPKTSTFPTHFQDAFTTPQFPSYATPQQPHHPSMPPAQRPQSSEALQPNYYTGVGAVAVQGNGQNMPPPSQRDPNAYVVSPSYAHAYSDSVQIPLNQSFDSSQMQTPPPTRGTSAKRMQPQQIAFGTPSTIASRRYLTPQQPVVPAHAGLQMQQTPLQFPQLQFSPEMYQFAHIGPASAPVMPHSRIFWDHNESPIQPLPHSALDDPFAPATSNTHWNPVQPQQLAPQIAPFDTPDMNSFSVQTPAQRPVPTRTMSASYEMQNANGTMSAGVDPSLLYSSPIRPVRSNSKSNINRSQSATEDKQKKTATAQIHQRSETASSTDTVTSRSMTNLHRSNTTSVAQPRSAAVTSLSATESLSRSNGVNPILRTSSPVKRFGRPSLGSISEGRPRQRTSVILTVDENGIARTETKRIESSPTRSIRERYPALFDSDSSDAETDTSELIPSRPSSFIFDKRDERRAKAARLDPPVENLEGLSLPRSVSASSVKAGIPPSRAAMAATAQLRRHGSLRRSTPSRNSKRNLASSSATSLIDTCPIDLPVDGAAEQTVAIAPQVGETTWSDDNDTFDLPPSSAESALDVYNRRWSMMSFEQQNQRAPVISPQHQMHQPILPGTVNPHQTRPLQIRCICGIPESSGHPLIQCASCTQWLHAPCVAVDVRSPPSTFTCFLCTKPPPPRPMSARQKSSVH